MSLQNLLGRTIPAAAVWPFCLAAPAADAVVFPGATWEQRSPASVELDGRKLDEFAAKVGGDGCIIKDGYLVKAWGRIAAHHDWASAAKPVLSTLLLLAVQEGRLTGVDSLVKNVGWEKMGEFTGIRCFIHEPRMNASLKFLRKTPWARTKVEDVYLRYTANALDK